MSRNFQFNPQTMQQLPAGSMRQVLNPAFNVGVWDATVDVCLPYIKGFRTPYYATVLNYTVPSVRGYTAEQTHEGLAGDFHLAALLRFDLYIHLRDLLAHGRCDAYHRQSALQLRAVFGEPFRSFTDAAAGAARLLHRLPHMRCRAAAVRCCAAVTP